MLEPYAELLKKGEVVAFPTETVYGLGADAWNPSAIKKVFECKGRPSDNPLIVHIASLQSVQDFAAEVTEDARKLMQQFWPGPLTLIFRKKPEVLDLITAGLDTVALRWPNHPKAQELISITGPLVAPSANTSGKPSPTKAEHVKEDFGSEFPVVDAGKTEIGLESTVLDVSCKPYRIYRPGAISADDITRVIESEVTVSIPSENIAAKSPGTKYSHYAPKAEVCWWEYDSEIQSDTLYLFHHLNRKGKNVICYKQDYRKMARELYDRFRQADHLELKKVIIEPFTGDQLQQPLVQALLNRISKAVK